MGIFDRLSRLVKSNVNAALDRAQDPGKQVDQLIVEMESAVKETRQAVIDALANEKLARTRAEGHRKSVVEWQERAERAVRAGDDDLARQALERQASLEGELAIANQAVNEASVYVEKLRAALAGVEARLLEVKANKEIIKQRARVAQGRSDLAQPAGLKQFDDAVAKIDAAEAQAEIDEELRAMTHEDQKSKDAERRLDALAKDAALDDKLKALKEKMKK